MFRLGKTTSVLKHCRCLAEHAVNAANYQVNVVLLSTSQTLFRRRKINEANPGLDRRLNLFKESNDDDDGIRHAADRVDEDDLQEDFMNIKERNTNYSNDRPTDRERDALKRQIVKQKYFKTERQPNFLTWAEKEQIRQLHSSDELEWSTERLSQSFPAPETVIKKIVKSRWAQEDLDKIARHDKSVERNWKELLSGKLETDQQLKEHLMKFAKRNKAGLAHTFLKNSDYCENVLVPVENVEGEFSKMVKSSRGETSGTGQLKLEARTGRCVASAESPVVGRYSKDSDTFVLGATGATKEPRNASKLVTLTQYKQAFNISGVEVEEDEVLKIPPEQTEQRQVNLRPAVQGNNLIPGAEKLESSIHLQYPERITIPKSKWVEGGTYKAGDCYYDDDGEFLYRVPGMK